MKDSEIQLIRPPIPVRCAPDLRVHRRPVFDRAPAFISGSVFVHDLFRF